MTLIRRKIILMMFMLVASVLTVALHPNHKIANPEHQIDLETMIPKQFLDWKLDTSLVPIKISPEVEARLDKIYSQTLTRTYVDEHGDRIMLSIAYGGEQSSSLQVHRPNVCYSAQGFQINNMVKSSIRASTGNIPVMHMVATQGARIEPITYWITVGDTVVRGWWEQKLAKVKYGLTGEVPDGILVRVSNISSDVLVSYSLHERFINEMLKAMQESDKTKLVGKLHL